MKFIGPQWQTQTSGGDGGSVVDFKIKYQLERPNDLENGLWIKNDKQLPLLEVSDWNRMEFPNNHTIDQYQIANVQMYNKLTNTGTSFYRYTDWKQYFLVDEHKILMFLTDYTTKSGYNVTGGWVQLYDLSDSMWIDSTGNKHSESQISQYAYNTTNYCTSINTNYCVSQKTIHRIGDMFYILGGFKYLSNKVYTDNSIYIYDYQNNIMTKSSTNLPLSICTCNTIDWTDSSTGKQYIIIFGINQGTNYSAVDTYYINSISNIILYNITDNICTNITGYQAASEVFYYEIRNNILYMYGGICYSNYWYYNSSGGGNASSVNYIQKFNLSTKTFLTKETINSSNQFYSSYSSTGTSSSGDLNARTIGIRYLNSLKFGNKYYWCDGSNLYDLTLSNTAIPMDQFFKYQIVKNWNNIVPNYRLFNTTISLSCSNNGYYRNLIDPVNNAMVSNYVVLAGYSNNPNIVYIIKPGTKSSSFVYDQPVKCYPVKYTSGGTPNKLQLNNNSLNSVDSMVSSETGIATNPDSSTYNKAYQISKVYKPDYSGEEQEAWLVSGSIWTLVGGGQQDETSTFKGVLLNITPSTTIDGTQDCVWIIYNNSYPYKRKYIIGSTSYVYFSSNYCNSQNLYIKADLIAGFDDTHTWDNAYTSELFKNVKIVAPSLFYYDSASNSEISYLPFISGTIANNVKYISIRFCEQCKNSSYASDGLVPIEVYV